MIIDYRVQSYKGVSFDKESDMYKRIIERIKYNIFFILDYKTLLPVYKVKTRKELIEAIATNFIEFTETIPDRKFALPIEFDIIKSMRFGKYNTLSKCLAGTLFSYTNSQRGIRVQKRNGMIFPFKVEEYYPLFKKLLSEYKKYKNQLPQGRTLEKNEYGYYHIVEKSKNLEGKEFKIAYDGYPGQNEIIEKFVRNNSFGNIDNGFVESIIEHFYVWNIDMFEESLKGN